MYCENLTMFLTNMMLTPKVQYLFVLSQIIDYEDLWWHLQMFYLYSKYPSLDARTGWISIPGGISFHILAWSKSTILKYIKSFHFAQNTEEHIFKKKWNLNDI